MRAGGRSENHTQDGSSAVLGTDTPGGVTLAATAARLVPWQGLVKLLGSRFRSTCSRAGSLWRADDKRRSLVQDQHARHDSTNNLPPSSSSVHYCLLELRPCMRASQ